jgi:hypothetical protein
MADKDYLFQVYSDSLTPFGPVGKENLDVVRLRFDFSKYLDVGETIDIVQFPTIDTVQPEQQQNNGVWRPDYPVDCGPAPAPVALPPDDYPLTIVSEAITTMGTHVDVRVNSGTPGFTYVVSILIVGATTRRRKQIDTLVAVEMPVNGLMVGPGQLDPDIIPPIIIAGSIALPMGFNGLVVLENSGNLTSLVITLPPNPDLGQLVEFIDALGKDGSYPVTFRGDGNVPVDGDLSVTFVSAINFDCLRFIWMGTNWIMESQRFGFLG